MSDSTVKCQCLKYILYMLIVNLPKSRNGYGVGITSYHMIDKKKKGEEKNRGLLCACDMAYVVGAFKQPGVVSIDWFDMS